MSSLQSHRLKPNPSARIAPARCLCSQLAGEWVDLKNVGTRNVDLTKVVVYHVAYKQNGSTEWELVVRIHSGSGPETEVSAADMAGANFHIFTKDQAKGHRPSSWAHCLWPVVVLLKRAQGHDAL